MSCLRRDIWQRLKTPLLPNDRTFRTASGSSMPVVGRCTIDLGVVGRNVKLECYVSEQLNHGLILGADFLQQNQANTNTNSRAATNCVCPVAKTSPPRPKS